MTDSAVETDEALRALLGRVKTIALVGASAKPDRAAHYVMAYLQQQGYRVLPVNPGLAGQTLLGETVLATLDDLPVAADMIDVFRDSKAVAGLIDDAIRLGIGAVWTQLGVIDDAAAERGRAAGLTVVQNRCPKIEIPRLGLERDV